MVMKENEKVFFGVCCLGLASVLIISSIRIDLLNERVSDLENEVEALKEETRLEIDTLKG